MRDLGEKVARRLKARLADFRAIDYVSEIPAGRPEEITGSASAVISVELCDGFRIAFGANHNPPSVREGGGMDWSKVSRIKILSIERRDAAND
jgi:hypothetical protein